MSEKRVAMSIMAQMNEIDLQGVPQIDYLISNNTFRKKDREWSLLTYKKFLFYNKVNFDTVLQEASELLMVISEEDKLKSVLNYILTGSIYHGKIEQDKLDEKKLNF